MNKLFKKSILSFAFLAIISLCLTNGKYLERVKAATSCPAGSYLLDDECHQCEKGYYCIGGTNARQECPGNRTTAGTGAQSNTACYAHCDANEYMISEAADDCSPCPSGQVSEAHNVYYGNTSTCSSQTTSTCTLTFNSNGGSSCSSNTGGCGGTINTSCSPTRSGYHFDGWYTAASGGSAVSFPLTLNSNMTIYAHWTANCSSCVCGTNGMPESYHCEICTAGQTSCDNVCANYGQSYISSTSCSNLTCTLTFNSNGGSSCSGNSGACGRDIASSTCSPTRSGYSFDGWYTSADGGSAVSFPITLSANRTVYAHWTKNSSGSSGGSTSYTITADANGGTISATTGWTNAADNKTATRSVNSGSTYGTLPTVTYTGKTLKEWNTKSDGTGTAVTSATTATATATIYAIWNNSDDGSGGQGGGDDQTGETKTITFNANGGTFTIDNESKESIEVSGAVTSTLQQLLTVMPTKAGYKLDGWYTETEGGYAVALENPLSDISVTTLYAHWSVADSELDPSLPISTLTYNSNGGTACAPSTKQVNTGNPWGELCTPTFKGYKFNGWFTAKTGGSKVTNETVANGDLTVYAQWRKATTVNPKTGIFTPIAAILLLGIVSSVTFLIVKRRSAGI